MGIDLELPDQLKLWVLLMMALSLLLMLGIDIDLVKTLALLLLLRLALLLLLNPGRDGYCLWIYKLLWVFISISY